MERNKRLFSVTEAKKLFSKLSKKSKVAQILAMIFVIKSSEHYKNLAKDEKELVEKIEIAFTSKKSPDFKELIKLGTDAFEHFYWGNAINQAPANQLGRSLARVHWAISEFDNDKKFEEFIERSKVEYSKISGVESQMNWWKEAIVKSYKEEPNWQSPT